MIKLTLAIFLEKTLNKVLTLDPQVSDFLNQHAGKIIQLDMTDLKQQIYFRIQPTKIYVHSQYSEPVDTCMTGSSLAFLKQLKPNAMAHELTVEGDMELANDMKFLLQNFDAHWQEYMGYLLGDFTTQRLDLFWQQAKQFVSQTKQRSLEDIVEFIQEEKFLLPPQEEVEDFYEDIHQLRLHIERLEARLQRIGHCLLKEK